jgi:hypothetical protein
LTTIQKFNELFVFFTQTYAKDIPEVSEHYEGSGIVDTTELNAVFSPQFFHTIIKEADAGEDDSDGEDYNILPKDEDTLTDLEESIRGLSIKPSVIRS